MLTSLLILFGLAPAGAADNPCLMPTWSQDQAMSIACDAKDALAAGKPSFTGPRTHQVFLHSGRNATGYTLVYTTASTGVALAAAKLIGPYGGVVTNVNEVDVAQGTAKIALSSFGLRFDAAPVGAVVALVPPVDAK